jgi:hypothetical protein
MPGLVRCACVAVDQGGSEAAEAATSNDGTRVTVSTKKSQVSVSSWLVKNPVLVANVVTQSIQTRSR